MKKQSPSRIPLCPLCHFKLVAGKFTLQGASVPLHRYSCCTHTHTHNPSSGTAAVTRKAGRDTDGPRGRLCAHSDPMHLPPCDGADAERGHEPGRSGGAGGVKTETMTRSLTDLSKLVHQRAFVPRTLKVRQL